MDFEYLKLEQSAAAVATIRLARPDSLNALNSALVDELRRAVESLPGSGARALLITGEGRGFSSGADLVGGGGGLPDDAGMALERHFNPLVEAIFALDIPVVAAVNGPAAGAGCSLALAADIVIAARSAYFLQAFVNIGLVPDGGASWMLPRIVGRARAIEMMMLGEKIHADKARDWGMVYEVVHEDVLDSEAWRLAERIAAGPTVALGMMRRQLHAALDGSYADAMAREADNQRAARGSADSMEGGIAFLQKRKPEFKGR